VTYNFKKIIHTVDHMKSVCDLLTLVSTYINTTFGYNSAKMTTLMTFMLGIYGLNVILDALMPPSTPNKQRIKLLIFSKFRYNTKFISNKN